MIKIQSKNKKYINALKQRQERLKKAAHMNLVKDEFTLVELADWLEVEKATAGQFVKQFNFLLNTHGAKKNRTYSWNTTFDDIMTNAGRYAVESFDNCKSLQPNPKDEKDKVIEKNRKQIKKLQNQLAEREILIKDLKSELERLQSSICQVKRIVSKCH